MMKIKNIVLILILICCFSCSQNDGEIVDFEKGESFEKTVSDRGYEDDVLHSEWFNKTGILHNKNLENLLNSFPKNVNPDNIRKHTAEFLQEKYNRRDVGDMYIFSKYQNASEMLDELFYKNWTEKQVYTIVKKDIEDFKAIEKYDYSLNTFLKTRLENVSKLTKAQQQAYYNFLSVVKHSFNFWSSRLNNNSSRKQIFDYKFFNRLAELAIADAVVHTVSLGGTGGFEYTTFDYVQSSYFRTTNFY
ncbi:hypothetical protein [Tenacibaculum amylolyticum]|uniref:hypothetical protein n=1 Tax=Tenacibaculum amylolyticum TaxID=104269 RepID=UPI003895E5C3